MSTVARSAPESPVVFPACLFDLYPAPLGEPPPEPLRDDPTAADHAWLAEDDARREAAAEGEPVMPELTDADWDELYADRSGQAFPDWEYAEIIAAVGSAAYAAQLRREGGAR